MDNVYDLVEDFYLHDQDWNTLLRQEYAEGFLRREAWTGKSEDELYRLWDQLTMLCLYLGNAEIFLGDMSSDDFIDGVAWCGRNISEFTTNYENTQYFLETCGRLFLYLKSQNAISEASAPFAAAQILLQGGKMRMINSDGTFMQAYRKNLLNATPDLPAKIFLNIGERLQNLLEFIHQFFQQDMFRVDMERAAFLYQGILLSEETPEKPGTEEYFQCFWDYFLFDYHLLINDQKPLQYFFEALCCPESKDYDKNFAYKNKDVLEELCKAKLVVFTVIGLSDEGIYNCKDFFTGESYFLNLPIDENTDTNDLLLLGHIFYNQSMIMNYVRCMRIGKVAQKRLLETLNRCKEWFMVQQTEATWEDFIARNPMLIRHILYIYSMYVRLGSFNHENKQLAYKATAEDSEKEDNVLMVIEQMLQPYYFSAHDIKLTKQIWLDFQNKIQKESRLYDIWAAATIYNFIKLNGVYSYDDDKISEICRHVAIKTMKVVAEEIKQVLEIEKHDPRYCNEEGLLLMVLT